MTRPGHGGVVGEDPDDVGAALDLTVQALEGLVDQTLRQCDSGKAQKASRSSLASSSMVATSGKRSAKVADDPVELLTDGGGVGLGEDRLDGGDHHVGVGPGHPGQDVAHEVDPAALPGRPDHHRLDGRLEAQVLVGDDEADPAQPPGPQRAQELGPKGPVLGVADGTAEHLAIAVHRDPVATTTARETTWWSTRPFR